MPLPRWKRLTDEWQLAYRIHRDRSQADLEREIISQHGQHVALHILSSKQEVQEFLDGVTAR